MAYVVRDTFGGSSSPLTVADGWVASDFKEANGVAEPLSYTADQYLIWNTIAGSTSHRVKFTLQGTTIRDFGVLTRLVTKTDVTTDHYLVRFTIGANVPPDWTTPDTITVSKIVSTVETPVTPINTSSLLLTAAVGNTISLRDERLTAGDTIAVMVLADGTNDQLFVLVNDVIRYHEEITGVASAGHFGLVNFDSTGDVGNNTYDDFSESDLTPRFVSKDGSAIDSNDGSDLTTNAWSTLGKGWNGQVTDEVVIIGAGTWTENVTGYTLSPAPRKPTALDDANYLIALAGATVKNEASIPLHGKVETAFLYTYGLQLRQSGATSGNPVVKFFENAPGVLPPHDCVVQGGHIVDAYVSGVQFFANVGVGLLDGNHQLIDVLVQGNGRQTGGFDHSLYIASRNNTIAWCDIDGSAYAAGHNAACEGYGLHAFAQSKPTDLNNTIAKYNRAHDHNLRPGILISSGVDMVCIGNQAYANNDGIEIGFDATDAQVVSNLCYENNQHGIADGAFDSLRTLIYNNTCADNGSHGIFGQALSVNASVTNNTAFGNGADQIGVHGSAVGWTELTNLETDPTFTDAAADDYTLQAASAAINAGTTLALVVVDILGRGRPQGIAYDIGAYEFATAPQGNPDAPVNVFPAEGFTVDINTATTLAGISVLDNNDPDLLTSVFFEADIGGTLSITAGDTTVT